VTRAGERSENGARPMKYLWACINCLALDKRVEQTIASVRTIWPDARSVPLVATIGRYRDFPFPEPPILPSVARHFAFIVYFDGAPTEFLKRSAYLTGEEGDYTLILDWDETVHAQGFSFADLRGSHYRVPLYSPPGSHDVNALRIFRVQRGIHHWGAHEVIFVDQRRYLYREAPVLKSLRIEHHRIGDDAYIAAKYHYYKEALHETERPFRQLMERNYAS